MAQINKQSKCKWFSTPWRACDDTVMLMAVPLAALFMVSVDDIVMVSRRTRKRFMHFICVNIIDNVYILEHVPV